MQDKIREAFMESMNETAKNEFLARELILKQNFNQTIPKICGEFMVPFHSNCKKMLDMQANNLSGPLEYVYISFLRTSVLDMRPCLKIEFFDARDLISSEECGALWEFAYVFSQLDQIREILSKQFGRQTRVPEYELDTIILQTADRFYHLALHFLPGILETCFELQPVLDFELLKRESVIQFFYGEYHDKKSLVYCWRQN